MFLRPLRKRYRELKSSAVDKICPSVRLSVVVMSSRRCTCLSSASSRWLENLSHVLLLLFNAPWNKTLCVQDSPVFFLFYISHKSRLKVEDASLPAGLHVYVRCNNLKSYTRYCCGRDGIRSVKGELPYLGRVISVYLPISDILVPVLLKHGGKKSCRQHAALRGI